MAKISRSLTLEILVKWVSSVEVRLTPAKYGAIILAPKIVFDAFVCQSNESKRVTDSQLLKFKLRVW